MDAMTISPLAPKAVVPKLADTHRVVAAADLAPYLGGVGISS